MSALAPTLEAGLAEPGGTAGSGGFADCAGRPVAGHAGERFERAPDEHVDAASDGVLSC
jgi:hypothetical protein